MIVGNGKKLTILHVGSKSSKSPLKSFRLQKVFHVSHLAINLISASTFCIDTLFEFHLNLFLVKDQDTRKALLQGKLENGLYKFPINHTGTSSKLFPFNPTILTTRNMNNMFDLWHDLRLGHPTANILNYMSYVH